MNKYCSMCGAILNSTDEDGMCHLCKMAIIFNEEIYPDIHDFAC